jgi:hypothetical protein
VTDDRYGPDLLSLGPNVTNVGISNNDFTVSSVPEPGVLALL